MSWLAVSARAQSVERKRPAEWEGLVHGGQFIDRLLPMPIRGELTSETWGSENVLPRDVTNGIEDSEWSYWGGNAVLGEDRKYHLYVCRWPENSPKGHFEYPDSTVVHAVSEDSLGPYKVKDTIGGGHNPTIYQLKNGRYIIYCVGHMYSSATLQGPWKRSAFDFHRRQRYSFKTLVNFTFAPREDGSYLAVSRRGYVWVSPTGQSVWHQVSSESVYPPVEGIFEDPVIWKTEVQYHLIANDWKGRIAYYMRSKDGIHWQTEPGEAYTPGIARYEDGTTVDWYKYERIRVLQDDHGRATQAHFAVIDIDKRSDLPNDKHSSKHICIPLTVGRLMSVLDTEMVTADTKEIRVNIKSEVGFDPHQDMDLKSLRFGASEEVNFGRGSKVLKTEKSGDDLIVVFDGQGHGITPDNFAGKLLGKTRAGKLLFGFSRLPGVDYIEPVLSSLQPQFAFTDDGLEAYVEVQNFGQIASQKTAVKVLVDIDGNQQVLASGTVRPLNPFEKTMVRLLCEDSLSSGSTHNVSVHLEGDGLKPVVFTKSVTVP